MLMLFFKLQNWITAVIEDEDGQGLTEYALIIALVAIVAILALKFLGGGVNSALSNVSSSLNSAGA